MTKRLRAFLLASLLLIPSLLWAAEIEVVNPQISVTEDGYVLAADFNFEFNERLEEAVTKGVVLYFVADFELTKPRWYWLEEKSATRSQTFRLSYHALTRQYRLTTGGLHQSFSSLTDALLVFSRIRGWLVVEKGDKAVRPGEPYEARLRLRLDLNQLPRPFQISALSTKDWSLASEWKAWSITLPPLNVAEVK
ncbi:MAG: DUF4390 domain-containing protein [Rhodocyclaceae bacterium]|nr:DUF4390 domain-containing protein [Rhodocyclaceae bacterium]